MTQLLKPEFVDENGYPREGVEVPAGGVLAMAPPLLDGIIEYADGSPQTVEQYAKDVTAFLMWTAEPHMTDRKSLGLTVMIFLIVLAGLVYYTKKKVWASAH